MARERQGTDDRTIRSREMLILTFLFVALFLGLMGYLVYYQAQISDDVVNSPYNRRRQDILAEKVVRGRLETADGKVIAETVQGDDGKEVRSYPYDNLFAHVGGYAINGGSGLEAYNNIRLLTSHVFFAKQFTNDLQGEKNIGDNVITTLNYDLQKTAYDALGSHRGAVVAIEPTTGKVLAMVSKPDYNPNQIELLWDSFVKEDSGDGTLVNRATQGQYPPGSTFKIFTLIEYLRENPNADTDYRYTCTGSHTNSQGDVINCYHKTVHGELDLKSSFTHSCNSSFVNIGLSIDRKKLVGLCESFGFGTEFYMGIAQKASSIKLDDKTTDYKLMQTVIGQGDTLVTPLQMALVSAAIANNGTEMTPYLVDRVENADGSTIKEYSADKWGTPLTEEECALLQEYMEETARSGTASALSGASYTVGGKTGSAEYGTTKGKSHAWFTGYAKKDGKDIAVSVIVEGAGSGSSAAVPIAKQMFDTYYK